MLPGKSYSFVVYRETMAAVHAFNAVHGKHLKEPNMGCLYLAFAEKLPNIEKCDYGVSLPPGLELIEDFVTEDEETVLLNSSVSAGDENDAAQSLKHRKVQHYGFKFRYDINNVDKDSPLPREIPKEFDFIIPRLKEKGCKKDIPYPDQLTVNQYAPGQGIPPHIDTHSAFEEHILSLSLGSSIVMEFEHHDGRNISVLLPQRSLLILSGEARYAWKHGITPRKMDVIHCKDGGLTVMNRGTRTSFTFRKVLRGECQCSFCDCCDIFQRKEVTQQVQNEEAASHLEEIHVHQVYERIANHFSETRHKPWPNVVKFLTSLPCGSILVDVGCGNGKYFGANAGIFEVGCDQSISLNRVCQEKGFQVFSCNCLMLPLRSSIADGCISIAVIHHLSTQERRLRAVEEMARILRSGGRALIYVWARNQECGRVKSNYLKYAEKKKNRSKCSAVGHISEIVNDRMPVPLDDENVCSIHGGSQSEPCSDKHHYLNEGYLSDSGCSNEDKQTLQQNCELGHSACNMERSTAIHIANPSRTSLKTARIHLPELPVHTNRTPFRHSDIFVPWKLKQPGSNKEQTMPVLYRYYHVFEEGELEKLCAGVKEIRIIRTYYDQGNWCIIFEKL